MKTPISGAGLRQIDRSTLGALTAELKDLNLQGLAQDPRLDPGQRAAVAQAQGNANGVLFDEDGATPAWARNVVVQYGKAQASVGRARGDEEAFIREVLGGLEAHWGQPVTRLPLSEVPKRGLEMAVRKASLLTRLGLTPDRVEDFTLSAAGKVNGASTRDQRIFGQRYATAPEQANGKTVVLSPGFQETGRSFELQVKTLLERGYDVVTFDHPWAGHSDGAEGTFDSVEGLARNVAAVCAYAEATRAAAHGDAPGSEVILFGNSMGGLAALAALTLNDAGAIALSRLEVRTDDAEARGVAARMPRGMKLFLQAPFLDLADGLLNKALGFAGAVPVVNRIKLPSNGVAPKITSDAAVGLHNAQETLLEHLSARPEALKKGLDGAARLEAFMAEHVPVGDVAIYHQRGDTLAKHDASQALAGFLRDQRGPAGVELVSAPGVDHVVQNDPDVYKDPLDLLERLARGEAGRVAHPAHPQPDLP
jgi:alpha-beta hydrolase superfamily lysophospholipase